MCVVLCVVSVKGVGNDRRVFNLDATKKISDVKTERMPSVLSGHH